MWANAPPQQPPELEQQPPTIPAVKVHGRRLIRRYPEPNTTVPFIKFGPLFGQDELSIKSAKEEAWQHVVSSSKSSEATVTEIYMSAIRSVEKEARASYDPNDPVMNTLSGRDFREMLLKDSCLFLQLFFSLLKGENDDFPHRRINSSLYGNKHKWIKSMFHVGNQIPLVVLRELLKQRYFRGVINKNGNWKEALSDLATTALFQVLLSPALETPRRISIQLANFGRRRRRLMLWNQQLKECRDVLHGLHLLLLGPEIDPEKDEYDDDDDDDDDDMDDVDPEEAQATDIHPEEGEEKEDAKLKNATKLKQSGIHFRVIKGGGGIRGISFKSNFVYPKLCLPPLLVGSQTQFLLRCLKQYEISQNLDSSQREVSSYLQFMRELIRTTQDAKILASDGIIKGNRKYTQKLSTILRELAPPSDDNRITDTGLSAVKIEINSFYRPPWVSDYFTIVFLLSVFGVGISIAQTAYAVLAYHKPPSSN